jgi:hypothetical protein
MYVYICVHVCIYIYIHVYIHVYVHIYTNIPVTGHTNMGQISNNGHQQTPITGQIFAHQVKINIGETVYIYR